MTALSDKGVATVRLAALLMLITLVVILSCTAYVRNGIWRDGIALWDDTVRKSPGKARVFYNAGLYYRRQNLNRKAVEYYSTAISLDPNHLRAYWNRGNALDDMNLPLRALEYFNTALSNGPTDTVLLRALLYNRGVTLKRLGRIGEAKRDFEKACLLDDIPACEALKQAWRPNS